MAAQNDPNAGPPVYDPSANTRPGKPTEPGSANGDFGGGNGYGFWSWSDTSKDWVWVDPYANAQAGATAAHNNPNANVSTPAGGAFHSNTGLEGGAGSFYNAQNDIPYVSSGAFGDKYSSNLSYTPFGLQGNNGFGGGMGAFGTQPKMNSDQVVPQLEQVRMQRMMQAYPQYGGK